MTTTTISAKEQENKETQNNFSSVELERNNEIETTDLRSTSFSSSNSSLSSLDKKETNNRSSLSSIRSFPDSQMISLNLNKEMINHNNTNHQNRVNTCNNHDNSTKYNESNNIVRFDPLVFPGPASVTLLNKDDLGKLYRSKIRSHSSMERKGSTIKSDELPDPASYKVQKRPINVVSKPDDSMIQRKGIVAAAALAAAATVPLPLRYRQNENDLLTPISKILSAQYSQNSIETNDQSLLKERNSNNVDRDSNIVTCHICNSQEKITLRDSNPDKIKLKNSIYIQCLTCHKWQHRSCYEETNLIKKSRFNCILCHSRLHYSVSTPVHNETNGSKIKKEYEEDELDETEEPKTFDKIETSQYKDKYVNQFITNHNDDDWVIPNHSNNNTTKLKTISKKVYTLQSCKEKDIIEEYQGMIDFQKNYIMKPENQYRIWGTTQPHVLFHPQWPLFIDSREMGGALRSLRRSCNPNVELITMRTTDNDVGVKFFIRAKRDIMKGEELHIDWQWDLRHPIWKILNGCLEFNGLNDMDKYWLIHSVETVLEGCDGCACENTDHCQLYKVREYSKILYKDFKSKSNNIFKLNEIINRKRKPVE
ncbi:Set4p NDAI_0G05380 [Naumovozyma dairenensis CBS 421]|uniref:SET domain-containing protein n=1 Tax=Naumovozyma dairenensis (strain ATCC 10597 / BCRC 20456 / CBS 421 / NBRC 0211 / NRRL Y-12639) TaxID=1071378 RepID=J7S4L5_NAUDC|nr:hypothetical protein NDAI_0G05380 [Naumovozyma dairenensis CBS 421]CCK73521.1 hypothetical protein NDAI_0G05380 [Naumovozyma dairenensis CBS 421]